MGQYEIPRKTKSETRLFLFFSIKGLIGTILGAILGICTGAILKFFGGSVSLLPILGIIFALIGFISVSVPIKRIKKIPVTAEVDGLHLYEIVFRFFKFKKRRSLKVLYRGERNE